MDYFKLPENYACLQKNNSQILAYSSDYKTRDTYELDNFQYLKVASSYSNYGYTPGICLPSDTTYLIPEDMAGHVFLGAIITAVALATVLFKVFSR